MKKTTKNLLFLTLGMFILAGCDKDDVENPPQANEEEVITTLQITFTPVGGSESSTFRFSDPDGDGGNSPLIDTLVLAAGTQYNAEITLLDESKNRGVDITEEIEEENDEHLFCFSSDKATVTRTDSDGTYEVGLNSRWTVGTAGNGTATIILKHQPDGKNGSCDPGETDIEVTFPVRVM